MNAVKTAVGSVFLYCKNNIRRFACIACILVFFVISSSFSYPVASPIFGKDAISREGEITNLTLASASKEAVTDQETSREYAPRIDNEIVTSKEESAKGENITFSRNDWRLVLVNKQHPIPDSYQFKLATITGGMKCDERIVTPLLDMIRAARADGVTLVICSPYRNNNRQTMLFNNKVDRYMDDGMSYMEAYNLTSQAVTIPGSSEHQIGLAVDLVTNNYTLLERDFANTAAGKWLAANCSDYGFILRYPEGKEKITSIEYEPWHFRYVGVEAAKFMTENNLCLEELWNIYVE